MIDFCNFLVQKCRIISSSNCAFTTDYYFSYSKHGKESNAFCQNISCWDFLRYALSEITKNVYGNWLSVCDQDISRRADRIHIKTETWHFNGTQKMSRECLVIIVYRKYRKWLIGFFFFSGQVATRCYLWKKSYSNSFRKFLMNNIDLWSRYLKSGWSY